MLNFHVRQLIYNFKALEVFCHVDEAFYFFNVISRKCEIKQTNIHTI